MSALPGFDGTADHGETQREADYYATPAPAIEPMVAELVRRCVPQPGRGWVLEAGCGHGATATALADAGYHVRGLDVRPEAVAECNRLGLERARAGRPGSIVAAQADFETWAGPASCGWGGECIAAVGNPPFWGDGKRMMRWLDKLMAFAPLVAQLLPTRFLQTAEKAAWHRANPCDALLLDDRPAFVRSGGKAECFWMFTPATGRDPDGNVCGRILRPDWRL